MKLAFKYIIMIYLKRFLAVLMYVLATPLLIVEVVLVLPTAYVLTGESYCETHNLLVFATINWLETGQWKWKYGQSEKNETFD